MSIRNSDEALYISKTERSVILWMEHSHLVTGNIFIAPYSQIYEEGPEDPVEVFSRANPFLTLKDTDEQISFVNFRTIMRASYAVNDDDMRESHPTLDIAVRVNIVGGETFEGVIRECLSDTHARLSDYINLGNVKFIKLYTGYGTDVMLFNKLFITQIEEVI